MVFWVNIVGWVDSIGCNVNFVLILNMNNESQPIFVPYFGPKMKSGISCRIE